MFDYLDSAVNGFAVDAAADEMNYLTSPWYGPGGAELDALAVNEWLSPAWCNPPYGRGLGQWLDKFAEQGSKGVHIAALLPAYVERIWWKEKVVDRGCDVIFLTGRVPFEKLCPHCHGEYPNSEDTCSACAGEGFVPGPNPRDPSAIVVYGPSASSKVGWFDWRNARAGEGFVEVGR